MTISAKRYHDISCGHRVVGHEGKCRCLHGHNYRVHFECVKITEDFREPGVDKLGRVVDFGIIKSTLCQWLEDWWDHKMVLWVEDPIGPMLRAAGEPVEYVPFNPTAENMARYLVEQIGPKMLPQDIRLISVTIEETAKCSATYTKGV